MKGGSILAILLVITMAATNGAIHGGPKSQGFQESYSYHPNDLTSYVVRTNKELIPDRFRVKEVKSLDNGILSKYEPFKTPRIEEESIFLKWVGTRPFYPSTIEVPLYINLRTVIARHVQACEQLHQWTTVATKQFCHGSPNKGECKHNDYVILSGAWNQCNGALERLILPLRAFADVGPYETYAYAIQSLDRGQLDAQGRFKRQTVGDLVKSTWDLNPLTGLIEEGHYWDAALMATSKLTKVVKDRRVRMGFESLTDIFGSAYKTVKDAISKPQDPETTLFDSKKFMDDQEEMLDPVILRSVISEVAALMDYSDSVMGALVSLINEDLSPILVDPRYLESTFFSAVAESKGKHVFPISADPLHLWKTKKDIYFDKEQALFKVVLKVPAQVKDKTCAMYRLQETPFSIGSGLSAILERNYEEIVEFCSHHTSSKRPTATILSQSDFVECTNNGQQYSCPKSPNLVRNGISVDHCLEGLMDNDEDKISEYCKIKLYTGGPVSLMLEQGVHFVHLNKEVQGRMGCDKGENNWDFDLGGNHILELRPDCTFYGSEFEIPATYADADYIPKMTRLAMGSNIQIITNVLKDNLQYLLDDKFAMYSGVTLNELKTAANEHQKEEEEHRKEEEERKEWKKKIYVSWATLGFLLVLAVILIGNFCRLHICHYYLTEEEKTQNKDVIRDALKTVEAAYCVALEARTISKGGSKKEQKQKNENDKIFVTDLVKSWGTSHCEINDLV